MRMYEDDFDGKLVPYALSSQNGGKRFTSLVYPYLSDASVFHCPADHLNVSNIGAGGVYGTTYGVNWYISGLAGSYGSTAYPGKPRTAVLDPGHTVCLSDSAVIATSTMYLPPTKWSENAKLAPNADIYYFYLPWDPSGWTGSGLALVRPFPRHAGRLNVAFYDGHAETISADRIPTKPTDQGQPGCIWDNVAG
jgi:prepilin-type processing-associated H-X9-DG protein